MTRSHFLGSMLLGRRRHILAGLLVGGSLIMGTAKASTAQPRSIPRNAPESSVRQRLDELLRSSAGLSDAEKLERVNQYFNRSIRYGADKLVWGQPDYWASPLETLERGTGDCKGFTIAKYFALRLLGIPEQNLRLIYTTLSANREAHMVLGYWGDGGEMPLILDNLVADIRPLAQRHDLQMQFAFDSNHLYRFDHDRLVAVGDAQLLPRWQRLKEKVAAEGLVGPESLQLATTATNGAQASALAK